MNRTAETLTGWPQTSAVGQRLREVFRVLDEQTQQPIDYPAHALREAGVDSHALLVGRDGGTIPIDCTIARMRDDSGRAVGAVVVFRDVSQHRSAEEAAARLAAIVASSDDAIV